MTFFRLSTSQDGTKDPKLTLRAQKLAPGATILFGLTLTGAAFDWLMSMLPTWLCRRIYTAVNLNNSHARKFCRHCSVNRRWSRSTIRLCI